MADASDIKYLREANFPLFSIAERSDGIIQATTADDLFLTLHDAQIFTEAIHRFIKGNRSLLLIIPGRHTSIDKEFRTYLASEEALKNLDAVAFVIQNIAQRKIADAFLAETQPRKPIRFFDNTHDAINWLLTFPSDGVPNNGNHLPVDNTAQDNQLIRGKEFNVIKRDDGIVQISTTDNAWITIDDARETMNAVNKITGDTPHPVLYLPGKHMSLDKHARSYYATAEALKNVSYMGVVVRNTPQRIMSNLYLMVDKPVKPVNFFDNEPDAIVWLKGTTHVTSDEPVADDEAINIFEDGATIVKEVHRPLFGFYLRSDRIVVLVTVDQAFFTMKDAKDFYDTQEEITNGIPHLFLGIPGRHVSIDRHLRAYMATEEALRFSIAEAYVLRSMAQRTMANLLLTVDKPVKPIRFFNNTHDAVAWLKNLPAA